MRVCFKIVGGCRYKRALKSAIHLHMQKPTTQKSKKNQESKNGITLDLKVLPGAKSNAFAGFHGDRLKVRISAKAVDGAANEALLQYIAQTFSVPASCVWLISGKTARLKTVFIACKPSSNDSDEAALLKLQTIAKKLASST